MSLTEHQNEKFNESLAILLNGRRLVIKGSAGVGKTYMVDELVKKLMNRYGIYHSGQIYCSAPTNKAVSVLKGKVKQNVSFITTHAALKMKRKIDRQTGKKSFEPSYHDKYPPLKGVKLFVIDEASMVNLNLLMYIEEHATRNGCTVIFIGDNKQLNPVGESDSPVFLGEPVLIPKSIHNVDKYPYMFKEYDDDYMVIFKPYPEVELTEIVRQKGGNPIIDLSRNLELVTSKQDNMNDVGGYVYTYDRNKIIERLAQENGTDKLKYLSWSNSDVDTMNDDVRKKIYGTPKKIELGETIVFDEPFGDYFTNEEVKIETLLVRENDFEYMSESILGMKTKFETIRLKYYSINYRENTDWETKEKMITDDIIVIHEDSEKEFNDKIKSLSTMANNKIIPWAEFYNFSEKFAKIKYNHALTVHKSQGSTFEKAIVNIKNLNFNKDAIERERLLYTAVTRASETLILYNV